VKTIGMEHACDFGTTERVAGRTLSTHSVPVEACRGRISQDTSALTDGAALLS
jgi:hypothetical protein